MKAAAGKAGLLAALLLLGCIMPGEDCPVSQYDDQGIAVTFLETDFSDIYAGNSLRLTVDVNNLGEAIGRNVEGRVIGPDNFFMVEGKQMKFPKTMADAEATIATFYPPDPSRCTEGDSEHNEITLYSYSGKRTPGGGVPISFELGYDYKSQAWADILAVSEAEWNRMGNTKPVPYQGQSYAPVKVSVQVPDTPIVVKEKGGIYMSDPIPIRVSLAYAIGGEAKAVVDMEPHEPPENLASANPYYYEGSGRTDGTEIYHRSYDGGNGFATSDYGKVCAYTGGYAGLLKQVPNCVESLNVELQGELGADGTLKSGLRFVIGEFGVNGRAYCGGTDTTLNCDCLDAEGKWVEQKPHAGIENDDAKNNQMAEKCRTMRLTPAKVTTEKKLPEEYVLWVQVWSREPVYQQTYKITATAHYRMNILYKTVPIVITNVGG